MDKLVLKNNHELRNAMSDETYEAWLKVTEVKGPPLLPAKDGKFPVLFSNSLIDCFRLSLSLSAL